MDDEIKGSVEITLICQKCGSNTFELPDEATDESPLTCKACGAEVGKWGDVKSAAIAKAQNQFVTDFKNAFEK